MPAAELSALVRAASEREHVKADLIQAVIQQESGSKPCAVSPKGAMGLMQLMPDVAERMRVKDPFDPKESVDGGVKLLKQLLDKYKGDVSLALGAYNAGEQKVDQTGTVPDIPETKNYVKSITRQISTPAAVGDGQATH
jgi:soluble lytic murein transglycosylase-like protein